MIYGQTGLYWTYNVSLARREGRGPRWSRGVETSTTKREVSRREECPKRDLAPDPSKLGRDKGDTFHL